MCRRLNEAWIALQYISETDSLVFVPEHSMRVFVSSKLPGLRSSYGSSSVVALEDHEALVTCLSVDRDGHLVISGDENGVVCVRWSKGEDLFSSVILKAHTGPVTAMKLSNIVNRQLITGGIDGSARVWQTLQHEQKIFPLYELHIGSSLICSMAISELNYVVGISDGTVYIFGGTGRGGEEEVPTPPLMAKLQHSRWPITMISSFIAQESNTVWATADSKGIVMIYNGLNSEGGKGEWIPIAEHNLGALPIALDFLECSNILCPILLTCTQDGSTLNLWKTSELPLDGPLPLPPPPRPVVRRAAVDSSAQVARLDHGEHGHGLSTEEDVESDNMPSPMNSRPSLQNNALDEEDILPQSFPPQPVERTAANYSVQVAPPSRHGGEYDKLAYHGVRTEDTTSSLRNVSSPPMTSRHDDCLENNSVFDVEGTVRNGGHIPPRNNSVRVVAPLSSTLSNPMIHSSARLTQAHRLHCSQSDVVFTEEKYKSIATASVNVDRNDFLYPNLIPVEQPPATTKYQAKKSMQPLSSSKVIKKRAVVHLEPTDRTFTNLQAPAIAESFQELAKFADPPFRDELDLSSEQDYYFIQ